MALAVKFTADVLRLSVPQHAVTGPWWVTGHQPELFHPGVWAKNIAVARAVQQWGGVGLNLIVDQDLGGTAGVLVPSGSWEQPVTRSVGWGITPPVQPWESVPWPEVDQLAAWPQKVSVALSHADWTPLAQSVWPAAIDLAAQRPRWVDALVAVRAKQERQWGLGNLELPLSWVGHSHAGLSFALDVWRRLPDFVRHHNTVLAEYRRLNRVRSRSHPVADLAVDGEWFEAPFWLWRADDPQRGRPFVRHRNGLVEVRLGSQTVWRCPLPSSAPGPAADHGGETEWNAAVTALHRELACGNWRLRTRALTTTLFARLALADLFVHGLGGAKYDEMTDALIGRVWGLIPPRFAVVSATCHLPFPDSPAPSAEDVGLWLQRRRDLDQNPQRHLGPSPHAAQQALMAERAALLQRLLEPKSPDNRWQRRSWYRRLLLINRQLAADLHTQRSDVEAQLVEARQQQTRQRILDSREYSWVLFPDQPLRALLCGLFPTAVDQPLSSNADPIAANISRTTTTGSAQRGDPLTLGLSPANGANEASSTTESVDERRC
jgi:hypothetical protein